MIYGPHFSHSYINRIHVDKDASEDQADSNKKRKVQYQGRFWAEKEENLPIQPKLDPPKPINSKSSVYVDRKLIEKAKKLFEKLTTLEDKIAQLFFLETESIYDSELQCEVELLLQTWQIGGCLFRKGEYKRQLYLIERLREIAKTPLLFANDFFHGLSFYLQGDTFKSEISLEHFTDLGRAIMCLNRRMGVHIQFDRERKEHRNQMSDAQAKAFRKGIRDSQGIVGKQKVLISYDPYLAASKTTINALSFKENGFLSQSFFDQSIQEFVGYKVLTFFEMHESVNMEQELLNAFRNHYDLFLFPKDQIIEAMKAFYRFFISNKIGEEELNRRVMKVLIIKALFF